MADNIYGNGTTTASAGANTITHYYDRAGVKAANRVNIYAQFADRKSLPKKHGKTFKISKFMHLYDREIDKAIGSDFDKFGFMTARTLTSVNASLAAATVTEGMGKNNVVTLKKVTMETPLARYGEMIDYTDEVELFSEDSMQVRYREELGELANSRNEDLIQLDMLGTTTVVYGGSSTSESTIDADSKVSYDLIRKGVRKLVRNRAKKNTSVVSGDVKVGTLPIAKAYYAIIGANVKGDLETLTRGDIAVNGNTEYVYVPAHKYASAATLADGEVGAMHEVRFIESESAIVLDGAGAVDTVNPEGLSATGGNFDVFPILFPTEGSFATVSLKGQGKIKFNSRSPEFVTNENPYGTSGFFSYNFFYGGIILQEEKLLKILVSASA